MKVIELLNKIANEEKVPKKIKINNIIFEYRGDDYLFEDENHEWWLFSNGYVDKFEWLDCFLKTEVEIIEEPQEHKIPEKFRINYEIDEENTINMKEATMLECDLACKINEIIDYLEEENGN